MTHPEEEEEEEKEEEEKEAAEEAEEAEKEKKKKTETLVTGDDANEAESAPIQSPIQSSTQSSTQSPIVRGAVKVAKLLMEAPKKGCLKPIVFVLKALSAPSRSWKGPAPPLIQVFTQLFHKMGSSNYWILVFALPGMSRTEALNTLSEIVMHR
jgi:hypothetical protein